MEINCTLVECRRENSNNPQPLFRFLLLDAPSPSSLPHYVRELQKRHVKHLIRVCGPTYKAEIVEQAGIATHAWQFDDGAPPPRNVIENWLQLLDSELQQDPGAEPTTLAVHCVAGLGRAPVLVAVALIEYGLMPPLDAVGFIRERRKGAINQVQLNWLMQYKSRQKKDGRSRFTPCCAAM